MRNTRPGHGARWLGEATRFRVWAPEARGVELVLGPEDGTTRVAMAPLDGGWFELRRPDSPPGTRYRYSIDDGSPLPDPASSFQPAGVHGPSEVVDHGAFPWTDQDWSGVRLDDLVLYELHVGTFTPEGTFGAAIHRLPYLAELGVTAIELMPVADFPGERNWGYDGVAPYAPARCYGRPDDLRALVDAAHGAGLAVHLDVVYNHLGPDGAYQGSYASRYYSVTHQTPWGAAINFDGPDSAPVRQYVVDNAVAWIRDYHIDGLRLDATHAIMDESPRHILAEIADAVHQAGREAGRAALVIAEDARNLAHLVRPEAEGGFGLDAVWSDDFHHQMRRRLAGDRDGYFQDFDGTAADIAATVRQGWFYCGQHSGYTGRPRGSDPAGLSPRRFVMFLQNHDQVGNRAYGERLHHQVAPSAYRAASVLLLLLPETPLLFMGQEWAASSPMLFFTDHHEALGEAVRNGRRAEFARFAAFADSATRARIPDPQAASTFANSRLSWREQDEKYHRQVLLLYRALLALRRGHPPAGSGAAEVADWSPDVLLLRREGPGGSGLLAVIRLEGSGAVDLAGHAAARLAPGQRWQLALSTGDPAFNADGPAIGVEAGGTGPGESGTALAPVIHFPEAGAVVFTTGAHAR